MASFDKSEPPILFTPNFDLILNKAAPVPQPEKKTRLKRLLVEFELRIKLDLIMEHFKMKSEMTDPIQILNRFLQL